MVLGSGRVVSARRRPRDRYGLELTTTPAAAAAFHDALERLLSLEDGAEECLARALDLDPGFSLAHAVAATVLAERTGDRAAVRRYLHAARHGAHRATEREASFVTASVLWCTDGLSGDASLLRHVRSWPADAYALSLLTPSIASAGVSAGVVDVWSLLDDVVPSYPAEDWWLSGIRAFARTEQYRWGEAEELAAAALEARAGAGHAAHALAHVRYETGQHSQALAWLNSWMDGPGRTQTYRGHFAWHAALVELATGDFEAVRRRFDRDLAGLTGNRALIDAGSLLVRAKVHGHSMSSDRVDRVAAAAGPAARTPTSPFLAWHAALLAGCRADTGWLADIEARVHEQARVRGPAADSWSLVASVCRASQAILDADYLRGAALLGSLGDTSLLGGSPAQRELLDDLALWCLAQAGEVDAAARLAAGRLRRRPGAFDLDLASRAATSPLP